MEGVPWEFWSLTLPLVGGDGGGTLGGGFVLGNSVGSPFERNSMTFSLGGSSNMTLHVYSKLSVLTGILLLKNLQYKRSDTRGKRNHNYRDDTMESNSRDKLIRYLHNDERDHEWEGSEGDDSYRKRENPQYCSEEEVHKSEYGCKYESWSISVPDLYPIDIPRSRYPVDDSGWDEELEDRVHRSWMLEIWRLKFGAWLSPL